MSIKVKLDRVVLLITNSPPSSSIPLEVKIILKKEKRKNIWCVTDDMLHMSYDTWLVTRDMWHTEGGEGSVKSSGPWPKRFGTKAQPSDPCILNIEPSWLVAAVSETWVVSEKLSEWLSEPGSLPLPQAAPVAQHLPLHLYKSLTGGSCSCHQSLVLQRLMVRYSWWRHSLGVVFTVPNFPRSIFDPLSCTGTQWIGDKVIMK